MTVQCFTGKHLRWSGYIGVPLLLLTGLGIPLVSLAVLLYHRHALDLTSVRLRYGFIYRPYRCDIRICLADTLHSTLLECCCMLTAHPI